MNHRITITQVLSWKPCGEYTLDRLWELAPRGSLAVWEILHLDILVRHRLWLVLRESVLPTPMLHELACRYAERALCSLWEPDPRSWAAIGAKRAWMRGEISDLQLVEAGFAARDAWRDSGGTNAAWAAVEAAETVFVECAAYAAAGAIPPEEQVEEMKKILKETNDASD